MSSSNSIAKQKSCGIKKSILNLPCSGDLFEESDDDQIGSDIIRSDLKLDLPVHDHIIKEESEDSDFYMCLKPIQAQFSTVSSDSSDEHCEAFEFNSDDQESISFSD